MSLRDDVAKCLMAAFNKADPSANWGSQESLDAMADECVRQMEWARHIMMIELADEAGQDLDFCKGHTDAVARLTLAPEDWKP
jgi:hypothetical protein